MIIFDKPAQFFTATNLNWLHILKYDTCKQFLVDALRFRVAKKEVTIYGFVIMPNHIHIIWQIHDGLERKDFQRDFLKFTAKHILNWCSENDILLYNQLEVKARDRNYQVWERNSLSIDIYSELVLFQKLNYLHNNPLQPHWNLCEKPFEYKYSSCKFYETGFDEFCFLQHYKG
jgi:REP element-mobilizing transposase RayT